MLATYHRPYGTRVCLSCSLDFSPNEHPDSVDYSGPAHASVHAFARSLRRRSLPQPHIAVGAEDDQSSSVNRKAPTRSSAVEYSSRETVQADCIIPSLVAAAAVRANGA